MSRSGSLQSINLAPTMKGDEGTKSEASKKEGQLVKSSVQSKAWLRMQTLHVRQGSFRKLFFHMAWGQALFCLIKDINWMSIDF